MSNIIYGSKKCSGCDNIITYGSKEAYIRAIKNNTKCKFCAHIYTKPKVKFCRNCPECNKLLTYKQPSNYYNSKKNNTLCRSCSQLGERHHWNKVPFPERLKDQQRIKWTGKNNPNYGGNFSDSHRKNLSNSIKNSPKCKAIRDKRRGIPIKKEIRNKIRLSIIKDLENKLGHQLHPNYNKTACKIFEQINIEFGWHGQHAENGGEYHIKELGYWVDYYEPNLNIVIEYDEKKHNYGNSPIKDEMRQKEIENLLNCKFYRIKEYQDWKLILTKEECT